jgi:hypothetical protein
MRYILLLCSLIVGKLITAQNYILPDGEYMDTVCESKVNCKDYKIYYYQIGGKYPESSATLLKEAHTFLLNSKCKISGSGYITFRFMIDCEGQVMRKIQVLQTDEKYVACHFDKAIVNELFLFFKTMDKWKIAKPKELPGPVSYNAFMTFKLKNGKVINIIP